MACTFRVCVAFVEPICALSYEHVRACLHASVCSHVLNHVLTLMFEILPAVKSCRGPSAYQQRVTKNTRIEHLVEHHVTILKIKQHNEDVPHSEARRERERERGRERERQRESSEGENEGDI